MKNSLISFGTKDTTWIMKLIIALFKKSLHLILLGSFRKTVLHLYNPPISYCHSLQIKSFQSCTVCCITDIILEFHWFRK